MMKTVKASIALSVMLVVTGCSAVDVMMGKAVKIDGHTYYYNTDGEIEIGSEELLRLQEENKVIRVKHVSKDSALILDPSEMTALMQDQEVFYSQLDRNPLLDEVSFILQKGSLKANLIRIAKAAGWETIEWGADHDYYIQSPAVLVSEDYISLAFDILSPYPLTATMNEEINQLQIAPVEG